MRKDKFLEGIDLILEGHEVGDCFITIAVLEAFEQGRMMVLYPSFGSLMDLRLIYSSYSKRPVFHRPLVLITYSYTSYEISRYTTDH